MGCSSSSTSRPKATAKFHQKYALGKNIGVGAFGIVRMARLRETDEPFAVKVLDLRAEKSARGAPADKLLAAAARNECLMWSRVEKHPNLVEFHGSFFEGHLGYLVCELCACDLPSRLDEFLDRKSGFHTVFSELLCGLAHVHGAGLVHRDIKPHNFLLGGCRGQTAKLGDFGAATAMPCEGLLIEVAGTCAFMSPEMLAGKGYDYQTDLWSLGVSAYFLLFGDLPYAPPMALPINLETMRYVFATQKEHSPSFEPAPDWPCHNRVAAEFVGALLQREPRKRCSAQEAQALPYLSAPEPVAREEYQERKQEVQRRNADLVSSRRKNSMGHRSLDKLLLRLQSSTTVRSFRRSMSTLAPGYTLRHDHAPVEPPALPNSDEHTRRTFDQPRLPVASADDTSTSASSEETPESPPLAAPLGKYKKRI